MGRGRKANAIKELNYNTIFYNSVGSYVQRINIYLSHSIESEPLSNHIKIAGGFAFKSADYVSNGIPIIRISDFGDERIILKSVKFYKESEQLKKYELKGGDIIIALTGGTIAKLGIVQKGIGKLYLNQRVGKFEILDPAIFENEYVYWIARSVQTIIKELAWGAAIPNVSPKQIEKIRFPIPDRQTQKGIILFLNDLKNNSIIKEKSYFHSETEAEILLIHENSLRSAGIVTELSHQQSLLKKLRQQILQDAIEGRLTKDWREQNPGVEPASELLKRIQAEKKQLIKDKKIKKQKELQTISKDEKLFELPERWEWCRLGDLINISSGDGLTSSNMKEGKIPVFGGNGITGYHDESNIYKVTVTIGRVGAHCGAVHLTPELAWITDNCFKVWFSKENVDIEYLVLHLKQMKLGKSAFKGAQPVISGKRVYPLITQISPLAEQKEIVKKIKKLFAICDQLEKQITNSQANAEQLMQSVLKEAFSQNSAA